MKRFLSAILTFVLLCGCAAVSAVAETDLDLVVVHCDEQGFSTCIPAEMSAEWEDGSGLRISVEEPGYVPFVLVSRRSPDVNLSDPENYLNNVYREYMEEKYGDNMIGTIPSKTFELYGKTLYGAQYFYTVQDTTLCLLRIVEQRADGDVEYSAKYIDGEGEETLQTMEIAIAYYEPDEEGAENADVAGNDSDTGLEKLNATPAQPIVSNTVEYSDERFYVTLPEGWQIMTAGEFSSFIFKAWDPANPNRTVFFFMKAEPFLKSEAAKKYYTGIVGGNENSVYRLYAEAPVMEECTLEAFLNVMPDIRDYCDLFYDIGWTVSSSILPQMTDVEIIERTDSTLPAPDDCKENIIARIAYKDYLGQDCEGLVTGQPRDPMSYYMGGVDTMTYTVNLFMGVTAPVGELEELEPILVDCLCSFGFTDDYVKEAIKFSNDLTKELQEQMRQIEAAHAAMMEAWYAREAAHDIAFQQLSDSILGYDRLYDSSTGEIYRADVGFYDSYNLNRYEYSNSNLYMIDSSSQSYYLQGVDYYITK